MSNKKILVIGASGFIGQSVCRILRENNMPYITHQEVRLDITNKDSFEFEGANEISHVIHLAGKTFVPDSWIKPTEFIEVNVIGTQNVAEFCRRNHSMLIYISAYIYGNTDLNPISESHPTNVNNPYALSKKMGEEVCLFYQSAFNIPIAIIRPFNVYGIGQNEMFLIPEVIRQIKMGGEIHVKDLNPKRDYIYVDDLAKIILNVLMQNKQGIFNAGTGISYSVKELIEIIQKVAGTNLPVVSEEKERVNEISDTIADISKAIRELKWTPKFGLEEGIRKIF